MTTRINLNSYPLLDSKESRECRFSYLLLNMDYTTKAFVERPNNRWLQVAQSVAQFSLLPFLLLAAGESVIKNGSFLVANLGLALANKIHDILYPVPKKEVSLPKDPLRILTEEEDSEEEFGSTPATPEIPRRGLASKTVMMSPLSPSVQPTPLPEMPREVPSPSISHQNLLFLKAAKVGALAIVYFFSGFAGILCMSMLIL